MPEVEQSKVNINENRNKQNLQASTVMLYICFFFAAVIAGLTIFSLIYGTTYLDLYNCWPLVVTCPVSAASLVFTIFCSHFIAQKDKKRAKIFNVIAIIITICIFITLIHFLIMLLVWVFSPHVVY